VAEALTQEVPPVAARKRSGWPVLVAIAGVVLACGAAWRLDLLGDATRADVVEEVPAKRSEPGALLPLDPFIANLADDDGKRYLKATVQLEFFASRVPDAVHARLPQMRDLLLTLFTSKRFAEIRTIEGKAFLRDEILNRVNRTLRRDLVKAVYFTEFIVE
jgi:flagellar FliL protein